MNYDEYSREILRALLWAILGLFIVAVVVIITVVLLATVFGEAAA